VRSVPLGVVFGLFAETYVGVYDVGRDVWRDDRAALTGECDICAVGVLTSVGGGGNGSSGGGAFFLPH